jgi:hypothetical protein
MSNTHDSIQDIWGQRSGYEGKGQWPARVDEHLEQTPDRWV